jgi:hypothetical protein
MSILVGRSNLMCCNSVIDLKYKHMSLFKNPFFLKYADAPFCLRYDNFVFLKDLFFGSTLHFYKFRLLRIIESVPKAFSRCTPLRTTVLRTEVCTVSVFFAKGDWLQAPALRAGLQTLASVLSKIIKLFPFCTHIFLGCSRNAVFS